MTDIKGPVATGEPSHGPEAEGAPTPSRWSLAAREIVGGNAVISILAVFAALLVGAVLIVLFSSDVQQSAGYFFAQPGATFSAAFGAIGDAYGALFNGSIFGKRGDLIQRLAPLSETLFNATSLVAAGLSVALAFRVGLFNIGARGQILVGVIAAGIVMFHSPLTGVAALLLAIVVGIIGGAVWGGIVGALRAWTGAHEVITTIMLNYVALNLLIFLLTTPVLQQSGQVNPKSPPIPVDSRIPLLFPDLGWRVDAGFLVVIAVTFGAWWLLNRSSMGFQFRAVGENPRAARVAGINVKATYLWVMMISGGLAGLAGVLFLTSSAQAGNGISPTFDAARLGFDAITVALLGRSRPLGVFFAALLFGALRAGSFDMRIFVSIDLVGVIQSVIVLLIAAPPLVRTLFHLPTPTGFHWRRAEKKVVTT
ncbi:MAG TPA: ABC transporter permease [Pseudolysinimonas sp.]|nr:ABC transporter permease [Pseudolysinimonas sp.]